MSINRDDRMIQNGTAIDENHMAPKDAPSDDEQAIQNGAATDEVEQHVQEQYVQEQYVQEQYVQEQEGNAQPPRYENQNGQGLTHQDANQNANQNANQDANQNGQGLPPRYTKQDYFQKRNDQLSFLPPEDAPTPDELKPHNGFQIRTLGGEHLKPGDNARYLRFARIGMDLPPIDIADPQQVLDRINLYFDNCEQYDRKPNIVGMANWLGVSRDTLNTWKNGDYRQKTHSAIIQRAVSMLEEQWVDYMMNGKVNPASGIFIGKNHYQYRDVRDVVVTPNNPLGDMNNEEAQQRIMDALPDDE